ncbi:anti-sigma factor family protein [Uniformispora flossi]|uniref:anti-sigma factor family protein n=1 Tax=Uniformispora flossi TaxID=3390723 RepID=UPI003C2AE262
MSAPVDHTDVGAYALGLLEAADVEAFEEHLASCPRCQAELDELGGMRALFADVDADAFTAPPTSPSSVGDGSRFRVAPASAPASASKDRRESTADAPTTATPTPLTDLDGRRSARNRTRRRAAIGLAAAAAAAALVIAGIGIGGGFDDSRSTPAQAQSPDHVMPTSPSGQLLLTGERHPADGSAAGLDGANGYIAVESKGWGSHVGLELSGVRGPLRCSLIAVAKDGRREEIGSWSVPDKGYGVPSNPTPLTFHGGTSLPKDALDHVEVRAEDGRTLLTIPV